MIYVNFKIIKYYNIIWVKHIIIRSREGFK